jgi:hypothetical protein
MTEHEVIDIGRQSANIDFDKPSRLGHASADRRLGMALVPDCVLGHVSSAGVKRLLKVTFLQEGLHSDEVVYNPAQAFRTASLKFQT